MIKQSHGKKLYVWLYESWSMNVYDYAQMEIVVKIFRRFNKFWFHFDGFSYGLISKMLV